MPALLVGLRDPAFLSASSVSYKNFASQIIMRSFFQRVHIQGFAAKRHEFIENVSRGLVRALEVFSRQL